MSEQSKYLEWAERLDLAASTAEQAGFAMTGIVNRRIAGLLRDAEAMRVERGDLKAKLAALATYRIDHRLDCEFDPPNAKACTCGLDALLASAKAQS